MELYKKRDIWTQRHAGKMPHDHIGRDGVMQPQTNTAGAPEAGGTGRVPARARRVGAGRGAEGGGGAWPCRHPDFRLMASRTVSESKSVALSYPACYHLLRQP